MGSRELPMIAFNRGLVSRLGLSRQDVKRIAMSAQIMTNWAPRVLGSMSIRPGFGYLGATKNNSAAKFLEFIFSTTDKALLELTDLLMRVWVADTLVTRLAVGTTVVNGNFTTDLSNWTDNDEAGGVSQWVTPAYMELLGTGTNAAIRDQAVVVAAADLNVEHALRIVIVRGPVTLRVGSTVGGDEYISETTLYTGTHSLTVTPTGNINIRFLSRVSRVVWVDSCNVEAAGVMELPTPWPATSLDYVRQDESADVVFVTCSGYQQRRIERRSTRSWSVVLFQSEDGPFKIQNVGPGTMTPSVLSGNGTLTSTIPFFKVGHVGALMAVTSIGQTVSKTIGAVNDATASIRVTGVGTNRAVTYTMTANAGTGNTVRIEQSFDNTIWTPYSTLSFANVNAGPTTFNDTLDNQIVYYRWNTTVYAAGTPIATLSYPTGSIRGIGRITDYTSPLVVSIEVLTNFGAVTASPNWEEGQWSDYRGWPTALAFYEGRLWFAGKDSIIGSVSDAFSSFDPQTVGDSGPISRTIGGAQVDTINWVLPLQRLLLGGMGGEYSCKSTSFDEPLTPSNFNPKRASTQGSARVRAVVIDNQGIFVQRGGTRVYTLSLGGGYQVIYDYTTTNLSSIVPEIGYPSIVRLGVQRQPDSRIHCVRSDGTVALLIFDSEEQVTCWCVIQTTGFVEDVAVLPGDIGDNEDHVYYVVRRTINGATVRYLERWAFESECHGDTVCKLADCYWVYQGAAATVITGIGHLEGQQVVVWADGQDVGTDADGNLIYTVTGGQITLATAASNVVVGLQYTAQFQSGKLLELQTQDGTPLGKTKSIKELGLILDRTHPKGIKFGADFTHLDEMPGIEDGYTVDQTTILDAYDQQPIIFPGILMNDARLCLQAVAPRPVTILSAVLNVEI